MPAAGGTSVTGFGGSYWSQTWGAGTPATGVSERPPWESQPLRTVPAGASPMPGAAGGGHSLEHTSTSLSRKVKRMWVYLGQLLAGKPTRL